MQAERPHALAVACENMGRDAKHRHKHARRRGNTQCEGVVLAGVGQVIPDDGLQLIPLGIDLLRKFTPVGHLQVRYSLQESLRYFPSTNEFTWKNLFSAWTRGIVVDPV